MTNHMWILGAPDPEMQEIEKLLRDCGEDVRYALSNWQDDSSRVHSGNAYAADGHTGGAPLADATDLRIYMVECDLPDLHSRYHPYHCSTLHPHAHIDHHRPGDPGYGRPPAEFLQASSIGQVYALIRSKEHIPLHILYTAASDHCLGAAYRGECPGVDPDALMRFRNQQRAEFQKRDVVDVMADITATIAAIRTAPLLDFGSGLVRDMRRKIPYPELPEAATRMNEAYISGPLQTPDGRKKYTCSGPPHIIAAFLATHAKIIGLTDTYGDPARGFAGGYLI